MALCLARVHVLRDAPGRLASGIVGLALFFRHGERNARPEPLVPAQRLRHRAAHALRIRLRQVGMDRQGQDARRQVLGNRQRRTVVLGGVGGLVMQRARIVDGAGHAALAQASLHPGARGFICQQHGVDRPGAGAVGNPGRDIDQIAQPAVIDRGDPLAYGQLLVEHVQLGQQHRGLQCIQAAIHAGAQHLVTGGAFTMGAQAAIKGGALIAVGEQRAAIPISAQRLAGKETRGGGLRLGAEFRAVQAGAEALRQVIDGEQALGLRHPVQRRPVRGLAEQVHADQRPWAQLPRRPDLRHPGRQMRWIDLERPRVHIHEHRCGAQQQRHLGSGGVSEGGQEHRVARPDPLGHHGNLQGVGAGADAHAVARPAIRSQALFQLRHFRPQDKLTMRQHRLQPGPQAGRNAGLLRLQIQERHRGHVMLRTRRAGRHRRCVRIPGPCARAGPAPARPVPPGWRRQSRRWRGPQWPGPRCGAAPSAGRRGP